MKHQSVQVSLALRAISLSSLFLIGAVVSTACQLASTGDDGGGLGGGPSGTAGDSGGDGDGDMGGAPGDGEHLSCPKGATVVLSDFVSTQIALSALDGTTRQESLISTASSTTDGLAFALSGDIVIPQNVPESGNVVLLDRFGTNVITWVDPYSGEVVDQLPVGTGFESNPQDYLEVDDSTAWVTRWGQNAAPGSESFDDGGDILILDLKSHSIADSIVISPEDDLPSRPAGMTRVGDQVLVTLDRIALDFSETGESQILRFDVKDGKLKKKHVIEGRKACGRATWSPDRKSLVVACTGALDFSGAVESISQSGVLILDPETFEIQQVFEAADLLNEPLQSGVAYADERTLLVKTQTVWGGSSNNRLFSLDLETGKTEVMLEAREDDQGAGKGIVYGDILCSPGCEDSCIMSDSDRGVLQVIKKKNGAWEVAGAVQVESAVGLPPVGVGGR